jgi:hypothetical protein
MKRIESALAACKLLVVAFSAATGGCLAFSGQVSTSPLPLRSLDYAGWTAADFDGDNQPDLAITEAKGRNGYILDVRLSTNLESGLRSQQPELPVLSTSPFGLHLTPRDVDRDHDLDIVITVGIARQPMAVWINDGQGRFAEGDLTSFPTWDSRESLSSLPEIPRDSAQTLFSDGRRCWLALGLASDSVQGLHCVAILQFRRNLRNSSCPASKETARAPPGQPFIS